MKYFVLLALLPCILAAEVHNAVCVDGTQCPQGKYCCESGCCDISKEMQDKGYVPALPPASQLNLTVFITELKTKDSVCYGTQCEDYCMEIVQGGTCCPNPRYGCPRNARCCGDSFSEVPWCCKISLLCGFVKNECLNDGDSCDGTQCGDYCFDNDYMIYDDYDDYNRTCCPNPQYSCPASTTCCGKYCCEFGCCDVPKEIQEKGYVPALPLNSTLTIAEPKTMNSVCFGTRCGDYCIKNVYGGTCCPNPRYGCPPIARCCGNSYSEVPWCCKKSQICSPIRNLCIDSVDTCEGTKCGSYCHQGRYLATCCNDPAHACSFGSKCCYVSYRIWCCLSSENCGSVENKYINTTDICIGTKCGPHCHRGPYTFTCCGNPKFACPNESKCCRDSYSGHYFCCKQNQQCGSTMNQCKNSAVSTSTAIMSVLFAVMIGLASKYSV